MQKNRVKRGWDFDPSFIEDFEKWIEATGVQKNIAVTLGLWVTMQLDGSMRDRLMDAMRSGEPLIPFAFDFLCADERQLMNDFRNLDADGQEMVEQAARERLRWLESHGERLIARHRPPRCSAIREPDLSDVERAAQEIADGKHDRPAERKKGSAG